MITLDHSGPGDCRRAGAVLALLSIAPARRPQPAAAHRRARTAIQFTLIGLVLKTLFANAHLAWVTLMSLFMLLWRDAR